MILFHYKMYMYIYKVENWLHGYLFFFDYLFFDSALFEDFMITGTQKYMTN